MLKRMSVYRAFHAFETDHFGEHLQKSSALLTMVEDRDVNGVTAYFRDCYDTGDIVSGRRREGERSVQYDVSGALPTNSCHGAKGRHVCAVKLNGADHQLNQNRIRALHGFLAIETGGPGFPSRTSDVKRNGGPGERGYWDVLGGT